MATQTLSNRYEGVIEPEVVNHALGRMKRLGLPRHEWDDLLQDLAIEIMAFRFDEGRSNGARRTTAVCSLVNHVLISHLRREHRYRKRLEALTPCESYEEPTALECDVRDACTRLTDRQRGVCAALVDDLSDSATARVLRCDRSTVRRMRRQIEDEFRRLGLDGWVR